MGGTDKKTRRTAVTGFVITMSLTIAGAYGLMNATVKKPNTLEDAARFLFATTALALVLSGIFILAVKKARSLFLETRFSVVLVALVLYNFIDLLTGYALRRSEQTRTVVADVIWVAFAILLYWALKNGPTIPDPITD
jgi:predicted membrane channel-forming protein YqfA (hemolysin III family)